MKKIKKIVCVAAVALLVTESFAINASAAYQIPQEIKVKYSDKKELGKDVTWRHEHTNGANVTDTVAYEVSRTKSTTYSGSSGVSISALSANISFGFEVAVGKSVTEKTTTSFLIPKGKYALKYGSLTETIYGAEEYWIFNKYAFEEPVSLKGTYSSFSDKQLIS